MYSCILRISLFTYGCNRYIWWGLLVANYKHCAKEKPPFWEVFKAKKIKYRITYLLTSREYQT